MYARKTQGIFIVLLICFVFSSFGCRSVPSEIVSDHGTGAATVRTDIAAISEGQAELAVTGEQIAGSGKNLADGLGELEQAIISGTDADKDLEAILRAIRSRPYSSNNKETN